MNAGKDKLRAISRAQANANRTGLPRYVYQWKGSYWISKTPPHGPMWGSREYTQVNPNGEVQAMYCGGAEAEQEKGT